MLTALCVQRGVYVTLSVSVGQFGHFGAFGYERIRKHAGRTKSRPHSVEDRSAPDCTLFVAAVAF